MIVDVALDEVQARAVATAARRWMSCLWSLLLVQLSRRVVVGLADVMANLVNICVLWKRNGA